MNDKNLEKIVVAISGCCGLFAGIVACFAWFSETNALIVLPLLMIYGLVLYAAVGYGILKLVSRLPVVSRNSNRPKRARKKLINWDKLDFVLPEFKTPRISASRLDLPFHELLICAVGLATLACGYYCLRLLFEVPAMAAVGSRIMPVISVVAACFALLSILRHVVPFLQACLRKLSSCTTQNGGA